MARFELKLPKMGESVAEATITNWLKQVGDKIEADEAVLEIATDKVDSEVPSEVSGVLVEQLFGKDDLVQVGQTIAIIETESGSVSEIKQEVVAPVEVAAIEKSIEVAKEAVSAPANFSDSDKFFSPLVKNIAKEEGISVAELENISGSGKDGRVTKEDILNYIKNRGSVAPNTVEAPKPVVQPQTTINKPQTAPVSVNGGDEIIEMDRMRKLISGYMVASVQTSAHVQSFIEVDVTNIVKWREKVKTAFEKREGEKLTYTPIFMEAVAKALKDFPMMNIAVDGDFIIKKKNINLGMAASLPNGNLIVPVIKNADLKNMTELAKDINNLAEKARNKKASLDDLQGACFTITNLGGIGGTYFTPIVNSPETSILGVSRGSYEPVYNGKEFEPRLMLPLSLSYDHRVIDGADAARFLRWVCEVIENPMKLLVEG